MSSRSCHVPGRSALVAPQIIREIQAPNLSPIARTFVARQTPCRVHGTGGYGGPGVCFYADGWRADAYRRGNLVHRASFLSALGFQSAASVGVDLGHQRLLRSDRLLPVPGDGQGDAWTF